MKQKIFECWRAGFKLKRIREETNLTESAVEVLFKEVLSEFFFSGEKRNEYLSRA